jgi:UDP-N-acetylglucosamine 2-epimerase (non-hydrolysing)
MKLGLIFGTRPQIIKCVPVIRECLRRNVQLELINTGQHYDFKLSQIFMQELEVPDPKYNLGIGSGSHALQTGNIMINVERALMDLKPSVCLIPGDTNSAIGSALASVKLKIPVAHLESGLRSYEEFMPEEINRKVIDHVSQLLFAPTIIANNNLLGEGILEHKIVLSGDTMYDLILSENNKITQLPLPEIAKNYSSYAVMTLHREENTETTNALVEVMAAIGDFNLPIIFPMHPRTRDKLEKSGLLSRAQKTKNLVMIEPLGYHEMMKLVQESSFLMTDSGGMQKEAFLLGIPCITLREKTEWMETVSIGANVLIPNIERIKILEAMTDVLQNRDQIIMKIQASGMPYGNGKAATKIVDELITRFN